MASPSGVADSSLPSSHRRNSNVVGRTATRSTAGSTPNPRRIRVQLGASWIPAPTSERGPACS